MALSRREASWIGLHSQSTSKACRFDRDLIELGERMTALLSSTKAQQNDFALATLDDLLGAIYALILAFHNDRTFKYRPQGQKIDPRAVLKRARSIAQAHRIRTGGKWIAGFHFNSALFRLSAVYHRSLKIVTGQPKSRHRVGDENDPGSLLSKAKKTYNGWRTHAWGNGSIKKVHKEVNGLKHTSAGIYWGRDVKETEAIWAVEELLELLEAWNSQP